MWVTGRSCPRPCALETEGTQISTRPPTSDNAVILDILLMPAPVWLRLRRADGEVDFPSQRLVRDLVGDLDLETVVTFRKRRQRHGLATLQLVARREVEVRRQRVRIQVLRVGLV